MNLAFTALIVVAVALWFLIDVGLLHLINRLFGIKTSTFVRSLAIVGAATVTMTILSVIGNLLDTGWFELVALAVFYGVAYVLYQKYFGTKIGRFVLIMLVYTVMWVAVAVIPAILIRGFILEPFVVDGNSMAPTYASGDYLFIEKYDRSVQKGSVVIASIDSEQDSYYVIARVSGIPGEVVNKTTIPDGYFYLGKDNPVATSTWMVPAAAIIGKPIIDLGYVDWFGTGEIVNTEVSNTVAGNLPIPPEADAQTFKILGSAGYAKDSRHVYFLQNGDPCPRNGCTAIIPQADPATFSVVPGSQYAKDKNNVYLPDQFGNVDVISSAEPKTFTFLGYTNVLADPNSSPDPFYGFYGKDKSHVFYASHLITEADTSFTFIRDAQGGFTSYARDKAHIYNAWTGTPIQDADVATFVVLGLYAKDKNHVYAYEPDSMESVFTIGKVLEGADPSTFQLVAGNSKYDAMDANHHWLNAKIAL